MGKKKQAPPIKIRNTTRLQKVRALIEDTKILNDCSFSPSTPKHSGRPKDLVDGKELEHEIEGHGDNLLVEVQVYADDYQDFKFRLRSDEIPYPFFRYDSVGQAHRNRHMPLGQDQVPCPHFNTYDEEGNSHAFQTEEMLNNETAFEDVKHAFKHYCENGSIDCNGQDPTIEVPYKLL